MDQDKKESFKWWWFILAVFIYGVLVCLWNGAELKNTYGTVPEAENETDFSLAAATINHIDNTCKFSDTTIFNETVKVVYPDFISEEKTIGRWSPDINTIELMQPKGITVQTVAHEVSHMVDSFMERYPGVDEHYRAYMQGYWTECVYDLLQRDIEEATQPAFGFVTNS